MIPYPKRLIEVDLPIKKISEHARREKSIRHGHISTLHIWWARRPLAACRAVICAALWPDPADPLCPESFKAEAEKQMAQFWNTMDTSARNVSDPVELRKALLDFIADFSKWDNSINERYLNPARALTQSAHEALGGDPGTRPLILDPFAGGGSIPLEALRVGADAYASDLNPVAVLLNKVVLEYIPKYGQVLADEVRKWGQWVKEETEKELAEFYPKDPDGSTPIAYLWARTINCEGPGCGTEVPLIKTLYLDSESSEPRYLNLFSDNKIIKTEVKKGIFPTNLNGTIKSWSVTCPRHECHFTTKKKRVQKQISDQKGGVKNSRLLAVGLSIPNHQGKFFRNPTERDLEIIRKSKLLIHKEPYKSILNLLDAELPKKEAHRAVGSQLPIYGFKTYEDLYTDRQKIALACFIKNIENIPLPKKDFGIIIRDILTLCLAKLADYSTSLCRWRHDGTFINPTLGGEKKYVMVSDFAENCPLSNSSGNWDGQIDWVARVIEREGACINTLGKAIQASADNQILPTDSISAFITDPPYYDSVPYSDLSNFYYIWHRKLLHEYHPEFYIPKIVPKTSEMTVDHPNNDDEKIEYRKNLQNAFLNGRLTTSPIGIAVIVFAHKSTSGWEALIEAIINAGWSIVASWPIDTELQNRLNARNNASLASSVHLVCRPRENPDGTLHEEIGEWSDVLAELPVRIREWMPRLKQENVVGADAIFACLGPALEIFSRYSRVEKASGEQVTLKEYLEKVWEAVEKEALTMIFEGADTTGFEEDARLTAMWLWTLKAGANGDSAASATEDTEAESDEDEEESKAVKPAKVAGYGLEYDAARKIAQGLGAHPEQMPNLIEIKKGNARLLSVTERAQYLFGKEDLSPKRRPKKRETQMTLFPGETVAEEPVAKGSLGELTSIGKTTLDRVHQSMLLFGNGQSGALKQFLIDEGIGKDPQFKKLAQALVALYPSGSDEKRWAEGVMSRMKGLGL